MSDLYEKSFLVNIEGPDDIEEFDTMREAAERANEINVDMVETISRGGDFAPHMWAVPWRTATYLAQFRDTKGREIGALLARGLSQGVPKQHTDEYDDDYIERMERERPDLSLDDLGFLPDPAVTEQREGEG